MSIPRVLLAWEQGRNLGHMTRLAKMSELITQRNCEPIWVIPPAWLAHPWIGCNRCHPAPMLRPLKASARAGGPSLGRPDSFADILLAQGFTEAQAVLIAVGQWLKIFESIRPAAIVCDYAPVAQLAARLGNIRTMQLTNGFDAPPVALPAFSGYARHSSSKSQSVERLSDTIRSVSKSLGSEVCLEEYLAWPRRLSDAIPETDPYGTRADFFYAGPFTLEKVMAVPRWPQASEQRAKHAFAYLRGGIASVGPVLESLRIAGVLTCCVWPDATDMALRRYEGSCIRIDRRPVKLNEAFERADVVVNYGSGSVVCSCVLAGKAQLMMPMDLEKSMFARRVESLGAGITWTPHAGAVATSVDRLLSDRSMKEAAEVIARRNSPMKLDQARDAAMDLLLSSSC